MFEGVKSMFEGVKNIFERVKSEIAFKEEKSNEGETLREKSQVKVLQGGKLTINPLEGLRA